MYSCNMFAKKVKTTEDWKAEHLIHTTTITPFTREIFDGPHDDWYWIVCPCGAKHLTTKKGELNCKF